MTCDDCAGTGTTPDLFGDPGPCPTCRPEENEQHTSGAIRYGISLDGPTVQPLTLFAAPDPFGTIPSEEW